MGSSPWEANDYYYVNSPDQNWEGILRMKAAKRIKNTIETENQPLDHGRKTSWYSPAGIH